MYQLSRSDLRTPSTLQRLEVKNSPGAENIPITTYNIVHIFSELTCTTGRLPIDPDILQS
jgi:hypothetical protein